MSNFGGNAGQDWETVNVGRSTKPFKKPTQGDKKQSLTSAQRSGAAVSQQRQFATANKSVGGHGPMGTSACLLYTSPSPRDQRGSRMPSSA